MLMLQLLGGRRLLRDGRDVGSEIRYRKGWAVLGYLAVARGHQHSRAMLAEWLWPGMEAAAARTNLRQVLTDLNQLFERNGCGKVLDVSRDNVALQGHPDFMIDAAMLDAGRRTPVAVDAAALEAASMDMASLGDEFMAGFALADCPLFEDWLEATRRDLNAATVSLLERLCQLHQNHGRLPQAVASARKLVVLDGWNENWQRLLMRLLAAAGLHQQALEHYQALSSNLMHELGVVPEPRTQALYAEIRAESRRAAVWSGESAAKAREALVRHWQEGQGSAPRESGQPETMTQRTLPIRDPRRQRTSVSGWLTVEHGPGSGRRIEVMAAPVMVGRGRDNDLCLPHDTVSRQHCMVWCEDGIFRVRDVGSTNGTRVNGALVQEAALDDGDSVVLGEMVLQFSLETVEVAG